MTRAASREIGPARYGGWTPDRPGRFLGLSGSAAIVIAASGLPLLAAVGAQAWPLALICVPIWIAVIVLVVVPIRGRSSLRWLADLTLFALGRLLGWSDWHSQAAAGLVHDAAVADLPGVLSGIRTHDGPPFGPMLVRPAIIADSRDHTWAATARIVHPGIGLAESSARVRLGNGLSELLDSTAATELVSTIALQVRTLPDDGAERSAWQHAHLRSDAPLLALRAGAELTAVMTRAGVRHEAFLTVVVPETRIAKPAREAGGGVDGRARVLYSVMAELEAGLLGSVGCTAVEWLDAAGLAEAIRTAFAPGDRAGLVTADLDEDAPIMAWPMAAAGPGSAPPAEQRHYQHDAWHSVSCTILLPDKGAVMGALAPVLTPSSMGERRAVTVFFEPLGQRRADRMIGRDAMSSDLAADLRRRGGFQNRATHARDAARIDRQDLRLADGNALVRVALAAAVTVPDTCSITDFGRRLESSITSAGFRPLRLDLAQDAAFVAACVPLGIGLPRRRGHS